jgi:hypothetical protein
LLDIKEGPFSLGQNANISEARHSKHYITNLINKIAYLFHSQDTETQALCTLPTAYSNRSKNTSAFRTVRKCSGYGKIEQPGISQSALFCIGLSAHGTVLTNTFPSATALFAISGSRGKIRNMGGETQHIAENRRALYEFHQSPHEPVDALAPG